MLQSTTQMAKRGSFKSIASFLFEIGSMRKIARAHRQSLLTNDLSDNISSHSYRAAWAGWFLAKQEGADPYKVLLMCMAHDIGETRSNDQNWVHKKYVKVFEDEISDDQTKNLASGQELAAILKEYKERKTKEAIIAKDADLIDQMLLLKEYIHQGNHEAVKWLGNGKKNKHFELLKTTSGIKLAKELVAQDPSDWWKNIWTEKRR